MSIRFGHFCPYERSVKAAKKVVPTCFFYSTGRLAVDYFSQFTLPYIVRTALPRFGKDSRLPDHLDAAKINLWATGDKRWMNDNVIENA